MRPPRIPSLKALRALEATARHRSLTKAADELNVTTAAISQQLKTLEHDFGTKLIDRKDGEFRVASLAQMGLPDLREGFERILFGVRKMREYESHRPLTIAIEPSFAATWLLRRLPKFTATHPDVNIRLDPSLRVVDLAHERGIDLGIRYGSGYYPGHRVDKLLSEEMFPVCSPALLEGEHPLRIPDDLRWHTLLHDDFETADKSIPTWEMWLKAAGCDVDDTAGLHFPLTSMAVEAAVLGHGVALTSRVIASGYLASGQLIRPFGPDVTTPVDFAYYLVCLKEVRERPNIAAFREWILNEASRAELATRNT
jgi:LysR family glycine cleavage system transcriptional activator